MKSTFNTISSLIIWSGLIISGLTSCQESTATTVHHAPTDLAVKLQKTNQIAVMRKEVENVAQNQFGVCDTCVTGYKSVIIENRLLANELAKQNLRMKQILDSNEVELQKIQTLHSTNRKTRQDYELRYALANNQ
ncbi:MULTISPECIES: hypothetical protein [unclassified Arcicella]|uniref:hypothetical protein n=1 Tax=unclassified Arcicella TaxID=2644986 RepID=UPI002858A9E0|nr:MULTISPECIES: hypothetical protein [unclassified Arcicella]MDR6564668.1 RNA polymerase-binding transcription factor DksA [Arcicella sp. BE51]MDR6814405.1 RNA polymerase-binding transcription factor DksA [Arcicella sp. BE140]MDR6825840.1 RNA polymerase-binding transcription factor DksA [Arcicella sp. BE139]